MQVLMIPSVHHRRHATSFASALASNYYFPDLDYIRKQLRDPNIQNPVYSPGAQDRTNGSVILTLFHKQRCTLLICKQFNDPKIAA